ncbi:MAG: replicative DNA helicase, partial [Selenomonadales bacterium]|nr:replicative DNA helicase [Selenomonadales bacterium]
MIERIPPQNLEAEYAVLGAMLIEKEAIAKVTEFLRAGDFYREANRLIFDAMMELYNKGEAIDMVTVTEHLRKQDKLERVGGIAYITSLANAVPTAANVVHHGKIVEEKSILRHLINSATQIAGMGYEDSEDVEDILDKAEK